MGIGSCATIYNYPLCHLWLLSSAPHCCHQNGKYRHFKNNCFSPNIQRNISTIWECHDLQKMTSSFYNAQWDLVNKVVVDFIPEMILNTTLDSSAARLGHQVLLSKPRKVNLFKWFTETPWSVVASEENIHLAQGCKTLKPAHASSWHTASMLVSLSAKALPSI